MEMVREYDKMMATAQAMRRRGGSFVQCLGKLIPLGDPDSRTRLLEAFPEYVQQYRAIAEKNDWYLHE